MSARAERLPQWAERQGGVLEGRPMRPLGHFCCFKRR